jgi:hypothetical protein
MMAASRRTGVPSAGEHKANLRAMRAKIHIAKKELGMDDDTYRAFLMLTVGAQSTRIMGYSALTQVLDALKAKGWKPKPFKKARSKQGRMVFAIWKDLYRAKIVRQSRPTAFVRKMTGKDHVDFCSPGDLNDVIEALKAMQSRGGSPESIGA